MLTNKGNRSGLTGIEILVAVALLGGAAAFFKSKIHLPFIETKADVQKKLDKEKQGHQLDLQVLASEKSLNSALQEEIAKRDAADAKHRDVDQSAANAVAKITAVGQVSPPVTRRDVVVNYAAQEAANALPAPTDYAAILKVVIDQLDELKTSNAQLDQQHRSDLQTIDGQKEALRIAQEDLDKQKLEVSRQKYENARIDADNRAKQKELDRREGVINQVVTNLNKIKYSLMGLVGLAGLALVGLGSAVSNKTFIIKGVVGLVVAVIGMIIPIEVYVGVIAAFMLVVAGYLAYHLHKEKTGADNSVGILGEVKQKFPDFWDQNIKSIAGEYWGTANKDVSKAKAWVNKRLFALNLLPQDKKP